MQNIIKKAHLIIYRIQQRGLEVFLVNHDLEGEDWHLPEAPLSKMNPDVIELDPVEKDGEQFQAIAVEGDWHDIPSLKGLIKQDVRLVTDKVFNELEKHGTYFAVKDAFKKVLPQQYAFLKELNMDKFRTFIRMCAGYNKLDEYLKTIDVNDRNELMASFVAPISRPKICASARITRNSIKSRFNAA